jgi:hypothetical protein
VVPTRENVFTTARGEINAGGFVLTGAAKRTCFAVTRYTELLKRRKHPDPVAFPSRISAGIVRGSSKRVAGKHAVVDNAVMAAQIRDFLIDMRGVK